MTKLLLAFVVTIVLGLLSRLRPVGWWVYDKSLGDALYAVAIYLLLALLLPRKPISWIAALALTISLAVEFFQATGIPANLARQCPPIRWLLGTTFAWHDVLCYLIGVVVITGIDLVLLRPVWRNNNGTRVVAPVPEVVLTPRY